MRRNSTTNKGGRPRKEDDVKKEIMRSVRFTAEEDEQITAKLAESGSSRSDFIRKAALGAKNVSIPQKETIKTVADYLKNLRNIGTNLNAIAHRANIDDLVFDASLLRETEKSCRELLQIFKEVKRKMMI